ncbi:MAG: hypothetical protein OSB65_03775 [Roseibacillus sp.]|nr:hypothetical protein [Roseibacillus sp.]
MKAFAILIILSAMALFGSAFFGVYTAPGLEKFPTVESLGKKKEGESKPRGIFPINSKGKVNERNNYLKSVQREVSPKG